MDCENEPCPICNGAKAIGKTKILECLHTVCDKCYIIRAGDGCPLCIKKHLHHKKEKNEKVKIN